VYVYVYVCMCVYLVRAGVHHISRGLQGRVRCQQAHGSHLEALIKYQSQRQTRCIELLDANEQRSVPVFTTTAMGPIPHRGAD